MCSSHKGSCTRQGNLELHFRNFLSDTSITCSYGKTVFMQVFLRVKSDRWVFVLFLDGYSRTVELDYLNEICGFRLADGVPDLLQLSQSYFILRC